MTVGAIAIAERPLRLPCRHIWPSFVKGRRTEAMPTVHLIGWHAYVLLLEHPDYLRFGETAFSHAVCSFVLKQTLQQNEGLFGR